MAWMKKNLNIWTGKPSRNVSVEELLKEELFPHIGGLESLYEKACFLAHMTRRLLWVAFKRITNDDRDAYPNKRVDSPGFLLANLFRTFFQVKMLKDMKFQRAFGDGSWQGDIAKQAAYFATVEFLEININELNRILKDVEVCCQQHTEMGWQINPERMGQ